MEIKREHQINFWYIIAAFIGVMLIQSLLFQPTHVKTIPYSEFQQLVDQDKVTDVVVGPSQITGTFKEPALTIYLLSGWLQSRYPQVDWFSHDAGHLLEMMFGWKANPHSGPFHVLSFLFIGGGFILLSMAWRVLHEAQGTHRLATTGIYARVRHPQYAAFIVIMFGFLLQWPTLLTLAMFPILVVMYVRLAHKEEREVRAEFGDVYDRYAARTPAWFPHLGGPTKEVAP